MFLQGRRGSGKTALLRALEARGLRCIPEYARKVIAQQRAVGGTGTSEQDPKLFIDLMLAQAIADYEAANKLSGRVIFDRGLPDLFAYAHYYGLDDSEIAKAAGRYRYDLCFFAPAWPNIYTQDEERSMTFQQAKRFGDVIWKSYLAQGYEPKRLPLCSVEQRLAFMGT